MQVHEVCSHREPTKKVEDLTVNNLKGICKMTQKEQIAKINKQTRNLNKRNERKLNVKISEPTKEELLKDHVMVDVEAQRRQDYIDIHGDSEMDFVMEDNYDL